MTVEQCAEYIACYSENHKEHFKERAVLLDGLARQVISGIGSMLDKKVKYEKLINIYPELFADQNYELKTSKQNESETWLGFLFE